MVCMVWLESVRRSKLHFMAFIFMLGHAVWLEMTQYNGGNGTIKAVGVGEFSLE